MKDKRFC